MKNGEQKEHMQCWHDWPRWDLCTHHEAGVTCLDSAGGRQEDHRNQCAACTEATALVRGTLALP